MNEHAREHEHEQKNPLTHAQRDEAQSDDPPPQPPGGPFEPQEQPQQ